jgi:hypothetical protein
MAVDQRGEQDDLATIQVMARVRPLLDLELDSPEFVEADENSIYVVTGTQVIFEGASNDRRASFKLGFMLKFYCRNCLGISSTACSERMQRRLMYLQRFLLY